MKTSRKTTTILNRSITSTTNWWGRLTQLALILLVVLFSCEEDINTIGIRRPTSKFRVTYAEIAVPSSVILFDKLSTYNGALPSDGAQRLLVGQYNDNEFGNIRSAIYAQISPSIDNSLITESATYDSMVLQLKTDFYQYGSRSVSEQTIQIHELVDTVKQVPYYNNSKITYDGYVIGEKQITIDPVEWDQNVLDNSDNVTTNNKIKKYRIVMSEYFGRRIFDTFINDSGITNDFTSFTGKHKGIAIIPSNCDKIIGFSPIIDGNTLADGTKLTLYYTENGVHKEINFVLYPFLNNPVIGFSSIESDRTGTALQSLTTPLTDFLPANNLRYVQSGIGIVTKLDFTKYFEYMDTVKNPILNSAELVFENETSDFPPPAQFQFRALGDDNRYKSALYDTIINGVNSQFYGPDLVSAYPYSVIFNSDGTMDVKSDIGGATPAYVSANTSNTISAFMTEFFQSQYTMLKNENRINYCALLPMTAQFRKTVNRFVLKDNIKLRIYYTTPIVEKTE